MEPSQDSTAPILGRDLEPLDVFVGPHLDSDLAVIIDQIDQETGDFDEHKCLLGFRSTSEAQDAYLANYDPGWKCGPLVGTSIDEFREWASNPAFRMAPASGDMHKRGRVLGKPDHIPAFTLAVDLDGTLLHEEPNGASCGVLGAPLPDAREVMDRVRALGVRIIVFTVRGDKDVVAKHLQQFDIPFHFINENPDQPADSSSKIIAHVYWDNRAVGWPGLRPALADLEQRVSRQIPGLDQHLADGVDIGDRDQPS